MTSHFPGKAPIESYGRGGFSFAGMSHRGSILVLPSGIYAWPADAAALKPEDFAMVLAERAGRDPVVGHLHRLTSNEIAVAVTGAAVGDVVVHFPRTGYVLTRVQ